MDVKIMTRFLLCVCLIASLSISLTNSASLDSRQRFRRQNDESIACPEGTKPCKDDNKMCVVYCNKNPECADGSDEIDCVTSAPSSSLSPITNATDSASASSITSATDAPSTFAPTATDVVTTSLPIIVNASATSLSAVTNASINSEITEKITISESTESHGLEMERANVPGETTEAGAATTVSGADEATTAEAADAAAETATAILADGTTIILPPGTIATLVAKVSTETVEPAATELVVGNTTIGAATVEPTTADVTVIEEVTATKLVADVEASTVEPVTADVTVIEEVTATQFVADVEASTVVLVDNGTDIITSIKPGNGHAEEDSITTSVAEATSNVEATTSNVEATTSDAEATTSDAEATTSDAEATTSDVEVTTIDVEATTNDVEVTTSVEVVTGETSFADNGTDTTVHSDVTTVSLNETETETETGSDTLWTTTIETLDDVEYEDESEEHAQPSTKTTTRSPINDNDDEKEDDAIDDGDITTTITTAALDEVEYYDDPDEFDVVQYTTKTTSRQTINPIITTTESTDVEYFDGDDEEENQANEDNLVKDIITSTTSTRKTITSTFQQVASLSTSNDDNVEYYDDPNEEIVTQSTVTSTKTTSTSTEDVEYYKDPDGEPIAQSTSTTQRIVPASTTLTLIEDVEYYDDPDEEPITQSTSTTQRIALVATTSTSTDDIEYYDDSEEMNQIQNSTTTTTTTATKVILTTQATDSIEYYDIDEDETIGGNQNPKEFLIVDANNHTTESNATEEVTTPAPLSTTTGGRVELRVVVSPEILQVQYGQTYELTCNVYGADANTNIYWIQEEPERRYALTEPAEANDKQITMSQVSLRARIRIDDQSKIGKYTCMAHDAAGNSGSAILTMQEGYRGYVPEPQVPIGPSYGPSNIPGYLRIVAPDMSDGDYVEIQCEGASPEDEGRIQWFFNNRLLSDEDPLFPRGKTLYIRPISRPYLGNYRCSIPGSSYADANSVLTFGPSQEVPTPSPPFVQPTGRCNIDEATCRNGRCIPRAYLYDGKNDCGDNSDEGAGSIGADGCQPNEIRCSNPDRGRKCVQKFWMCDGDRDCDDGSDEASNYCELLPRQRYCKPSEFHCGGPNATLTNPVCIPRSFQCDGYTDCPDRSDEAGCVKPTVISAPQRQIQINVGQTLTIQCTARGSPAPYINWRLNWGHVCGDGSDNGRCTMGQSIDSNDPSLVTGTLTVRNVNVADGGAYSCEALNNQGFIFAVPDAIVEVIHGGTVPPTAAPCNCYSHSSYCSPNGQCLNCQHNTAGNNCEYCAPGYEGDARRGTPYDCQPARIPSGEGACDPSGTYTERDGRCVCKYNVQGARCDQCKTSHFYLNPITPNGCLPCFCSGVSTDCTSTDWRRQAVALPLNNWNAVPKNFATDRYEASDRIQQRDGGRELALDQSSLGRSANEVLYWKAPKSALGDLVTLYDGNIDVYFTNDGNDNQAPSDDEFLWLRGNNIDLVHKLPQNQRFKANTQATYSVAVNERTFTRKDGTYIDRENILMALSDLDTLLVKINPIGGRKTAVLRGVTLNVAARSGYADAAPAVESCRCPANYTGASCEKCAEGYGRPHPLVGIYLGQCWSCRSLCNERSDQCNAETGKCYDCQGNSEGDQCERCRPGYVLDAQRNQCVSQDQYGRYPHGQGTENGIYVDQQPYTSGSTTPLRIVLDGNQVEQRIPVQVLNIQPQSVVWGRTDGTPLPPNVAQEGNDLVFRNPSSEQAGNYICIITTPGGIVDHINIYVDYRPGRPPVVGSGAVFSPPSPLTLNEGQSQLIQPQGGYYQVQWRRENGQPLPSGVNQNGNALQITNARPDQSGTYLCELHGVTGTQTVAYQINVIPGQGPPPSGGGPPRISIEPKTINLKEGQRMIVQYTVSSHDPIRVTWNKRTAFGYEPIPSLFQVENNRLVLNRATLDAAGVYQVVVSNDHGSDQQELRINVEPRRGRGRGQQSNAPQIRFQQSQYDVSHGETFDIVPTLYGAIGATISWSKDGSNYLPEGVTVLDGGVLRVEGRSSNIEGRYTLEVSSGYGRASSPIYIRWKDAPQNEGYGGTGQDGSRGYYGGYDQGYQTGYDQQQQNTYIEVTVEPAEASVKKGEKANLTCQVKGAQQYTVTWSKYAHDTTLPNYAHQEGNSVILAPTDDSPAEQMYLQCSVNVPGLSQPYLGYAPVMIRGGNEILKKKKKRRSL